MDPAELDRAVRGVLQGDRERYRDVVEACEARVRLALSPLLPDSSSIEDIAQETFVTAFANLDRYEPGTDFLGWIQAIARNLAQNERRRWVRRQSHARRYRALLEERLTPRLEKLTEGIGEDLRPVIRQCMALLQDHARGVVEAFYFDGLSSREIAEREGRPANWVLVVLHRARVALGQCLKAKGALTDEA